MKERRLLLSEKNLAWVEEVYPGVRLNLLVDMLLDKFREVHFMKPEDLALLGARELKKFLEERDG